MATLRSVSVITGGGGDYTSLSAAEAGEQGDISLATGSDEYVEFHCSGGQDSTHTIFSGWTLGTDVTNYIEIIGDDIHGGVWNTGAYRLETSANALTCELDKLRLTNLQLSSGGAGGNTSILNFTTVPTTDLRIDRCILRSQYTGPFGDNGITIAVDGSTGTIRNTLIYDCGATSTSTTATAINIGGGGGSNKQIYVHNVTIARCLIGINPGFSGGVRVRNVIYADLGISGTPDGYQSGSYHADSDFNTSSLVTDAPGGNSQNEVTPVFLDPDNDDFHLAAADTIARGQGEDLSGISPYPVIGDIDGQARTTWDIGADEFVVLAALGSLFSFPAPALDGAPVQVGDGAVVARNLFFDVGEYATPFYVRPDADATRQQRIDVLPVTLTLRCGEIAIRSTP